MAKMYHSAQLIHKEDTLEGIEVLKVASGPFDVVTFATPRTEVSVYLPVGWHEMMLEAIRKAYPSPICPTCYSIHIPGTACETHESYTHTTDPRLESPVS